MTEYSNIRTDHRVDFDPWCEHYSTVLLGTYLYRFQLFSFHRHFHYLFVGRRHCSVWVVFTVQLEKLSNNFNDAVGFKFTVIDISFVNPKYY